MTSNPFKLLLVRLLMIIVALVGWEVAVASNPDWLFFVASPRLVAAALAEMAVSADIYLDTLVTGSEALAGLMVGTFLGAASGLSLWYSPNIGRLLTPLVLALGAFPILALAPLMILWFGVGISMKIALAIFSTYFVAFAQAFRGAQLVNGRHLDFLRGMRANQSQIFIKVVVPGSLEWVFNSMRINIGLALLGAFIGEFIASNVGLGHLILRASSLYNVPRALAASFVVVVLSMAFDILGKLVELKRYKIVQLLTVPKVI